MDKMNTSVQSAKFWVHTMRQMLSPIEDILFERGWRRLDNMPNVWVSPSGETAFLAEAIKSLIPPREEPKP